MCHEDTINTWGRIFFDCSMGKCPEGRFAQIYNKHPMKEKRDPKKEYPYTPRSTRRSVKQMRKVKEEFTKPMFGL